jgi:hypothetical protein
LEGLERAKIQKVMSLNFRTIILCLAIFVGTPPYLHAQQDSTVSQQWLKPKPGDVLKASVMIQFWSIYTMGQEVYDTQNRRYEPVDDRLNMYLRRARFVVRGEPYHGLKYYTAMFFDQAGHDLLSATQGPTNPAEPAVGIWDAFVQWRIPVSKDGLHLTAGWFRPQFQRESITPAWAVGSMEKSMSQNYVRTQLTGRGPGRAAGINLGGMAKGNNWSLLYNTGLFNPLLTGLGGSSVGLAYAPLWTTRLSLAIGDPEMELYGISYTMNYYKRRNGISLDVNFARQGETDAFQSSITYGAGFLANHGAWTVDGEWTALRRSEGNLSSVGTTGHGRAGYNIPAGRFELQPVVMVMFYKGAMDASGQAHAKMLKLSSGMEQTLDFGVNLHLSPRNMVLQLHYTMHQGDAGASGEGSTVNAFFSQPHVGAIRRGNWIGLGLNAIF